MKLTVADLIQVDREVEIPDECPDCKVDLKEAGLRHWEYADQKRVVKIELDDKGERCIDWADILPSSGECDLPISWHCRECDYSLAEAHHEQPQDPELIATFKETFGWDTEKSTDEDSSAAATES